MWTYGTRRTIGSACRLCYTDSGCDVFSQDKRRTFLRCPTCSLVYVPDDFLLSDHAEMAEYDKHENAVDDAGYRKFLSRTSDALLALIPEVASSSSPEKLHLQKHVIGLDFGCGPAPALAQMLFESRGWHIDLFDKFYKPDRAVIDEETRSEYYSFITMTEVIEHLLDVGAELRSLWRLLRVGGFLVVMTKRVISQDRFHNWHYKNDPTHVSFLSDETFSWISSALEGGAVLQIQGPDVVVLRKL